MMEVGEKFNIIKFFNGLVNPVTGAKSIVIGLWICMFVVIGYTFWRAYGKKQPPTQTAETIVNYNLQPHAFGCARLLVPKK